MVVIKIRVVSSPLHDDSGGDAYLVKRLANKVLLSVVDGLGHGHMANLAANRTIELLKANQDTQLEKILDSIHKALANTVGVVLGLALVDYQFSQLTCAGVGNITIKLIGNNIDEVILPTGILGYRKNNFLLRTITISQDSLLLMHTDGILDCYKLNPSYLASPQQLVQTLMSKYRRPNDDVLVLVASELLNKDYEEQLIKT
ncbi:MAG: SpoIIE family protein phosphatase [Desulfitobacteriaceae bacterium]|nr:SpoIIE family protein phosphatase [Desulfitobacteriaceae bacterium]MDD4401851.1 SpoIIE family protein phosphatase [Desulfitobacteriaceae bacterium]